MYDDAISTALNIFTKIFSSNACCHSKTMKKIFALALMFTCSTNLLFAQIDENLKDDIRNTGYVHSPALDYSKSFESFGLTKKVRASQIQAFTALCETQPNHPDYKKWKEAIKLYGPYLKTIMQYDALYGLVPSGVYNVDEVRDSVNFYKAQAGIFSGAANDHKEQLEKCC